MKLNSAVPTEKSIKKNLIILGFLAVCAPASPACVQDLFLKSTNETNAIETKATAQLPSGTSPLEFNDIGR